MADYDVVVIGAGCGGLSAGALLAKQGRKVLLLEQSERIGGCCSTFEQAGYHFDLGASVIEDVEVIDWVFQRMGTSIWKECDLIPCDPTYDVILRDGRRVAYPISSEKTADEIARLSPQDREGWNRFSSHMKGFMDAALAGFFASPANDLTDLVRMFSRTPQLLKYGSLFVSSYQDVLRKYFQSDAVRESLSFQSFFVGLPPELCPGHFAMIPYSEHEGIYYTRGGMIGIPAALKECGERLGMEVRLRTLVDRVIVRNGRAVGVRLSDGTEITASLVVSDINAKVLYLNLIGEEHLPWLARVGIKSYEYSMATPMMYLGVDYKPPLNSHHTLVTLPQDDLNRFWWQDYKQGRFPVEQFGIVSWTSGSDPKLAPDGHHTIVLTLCPGAYKLAGSSWDERKGELKEKIIHYFSEKIIPGLEDHVTVAEFSTPVDFERRLLSPEGAIYALRQDLANSMMFRPSARSKSIQGLYLVGASTHPGGGVPTTISSGLIAADLIEKYE